MPPDANKIRRRKTTPHGANADDADDSTSATAAVVPQDDDRTIATNTTTANVGAKKCIATLKSSEVVIDGVVYDISTFDHPGGEQIHTFGGNDVTAVYKMIHPHHSSNSSGGNHHLRKMERVGYIANYSSGEQEYKFDTPFERELKREVFRIVKRGREFGTLGYFLRAAIYVGLFFYLHYLWCYAPQDNGRTYALAVMYGVSHSLIGLNVQHDANHGAASRNKYVNNVLGLGADLIGGCKWIWIQKHWWHHAYTNHVEKDPDSFSAEPFLLFNDYPLGHPKRTLWHAYQVLWFFFILGGYWISAVFNLRETLAVKDVGARNCGMTFHDDNEFLKSRAAYAFPLRVYYLLSNVALPLLQDGINWTTVAKINVMGISGSLFLGLLFTLSHNFEHADRDPTNSTQRQHGMARSAQEETTEHEHEHEPVCWYRCQVETSSTYGGMVSGWFTGGLNYQIEHHLFPRMSSAWYPYIQPTVRRVCEKHNVRYTYYPWIFQNMISTLKYTNAVGNGSNNNWKNQNPLKGEM